MRNLSPFVEPISISISPVALTSPIFGPDDALELHGELSAMFEDAKRGDTGGGA